MRHPESPTPWRFTEVSHSGDSFLCDANDRRVNSSQQNQLYAIDAVNYTAESVPVTRAFLREEMSLYEYRGRMLKLMQVYFGETE